jgi:uncharacterized CHY-type Zn-finger protein
MEEVLKGLQGKSLTKKKLFDFLADINLETISNKKEAPVPKPAEVKKEESKEEVKKEEAKKDKSIEEIQCGACMKIFSTKASMLRHQNRFTVCKDWIEQSQKIEINKLSKGIHLIIDELLDKAICDKELECKYCKARFVTKGNHHKHFNTSTVCNRMAYQEFKRLFNAL